MHVQRPIVSDRKIRFALVGCGRISSNHFDAIKQHSERAELVAVCDTDPVALAAATTRTSARGFDSLTEMLAESRADCVVLATPSGLHSRQVCEVAAAGVDVFEYFVVVECREELHNSQEFFVRFPEHLLPIRRMKCCCLRFLKTHLAYLNQTDNGASQHEPFLNAPFVIQQAYQNLSCKHA